MYVSSCTLTPDHAFYRSLECWGKFTNLFSEKHRGTIIIKNPTFYLIESQCIYIVFLFCVSYQRHTPWWEAELCASYWKSRKSWEVTVLLVLTKNPPHGNLYIECRKNTFNILVIVFLLLCTLGFFVMQRKIIIVVSSFYVLIYPYYVFFLFQDGFSHFLSGHRERKGNMCSNMCFSFKLSSIGYFLYIVAK